MLTSLTELAEVAGGVLGALLLAIAVGTLVRRAGRRITALDHLSQQTRAPFRVLAATLALYLGLRAAEPHRGEWLTLSHAVALVLIGAIAWLVMNLLFVLEETALIRVRTDVTDNRHARAVRTQVTVLRRFTAAAIAVLALGTMLMTFREARLVGTSLIASAGVVAAIAAFAANTLLGNVVAGLQIAFSGSLRLDDVVVINEEWGRIEEITLTYVVLHLWDDRRLILPTSYLTTQPFENWTHTQSSLLGAVLLDVDWTVPVQPMRERLRAYLTDHPLWDSRVSVLQTVDASQGRVTVRALVSARDAPTLWDLRCAVREDLIEWVRETGAEPKLRTTIMSDDTRPARDVTVASPADGRVFSGDRNSRARAESFAGPDRR
jgi:small-conductance mechanosensitive channel